MTSDDRRGGIDDIKYDWFMFPFVEVIHLPLLPNEGDIPLKWLRAEKCITTLLFSKGTAGYPPRLPFVPKNLLYSVHIFPYFMGYFSCISLVI